MARFIGLDSVLHYKIQNPLNYGDIQCWANNSAGSQGEACTVTHKPAGRLQIYLVLSSVLIPGWPLLVSHFIIDLYSGLFFYPCIYEE